MPLRGCLPERTARGNGVGSLREGLVAQVAETHGDAGVRRPGKESFGPRDCARTAPQRSRTGMIRTSGDFWPDLANVNHVGFAAEASIHEKPASAAKTQDPCAACWLLYWR